MRGKTIMRFPLKQLNVLFAVVVLFTTVFATAPRQTRAKINKAEETRASLIQDAGEGQGTKSASAASGSVTILMIGFPDQDSIDALTGDKKPGIGNLEAMFEKAN